MFQAEEAAGAKTEQGWLVQEHQGSQCGYSEQQGDRDGGGDEAPAVDRSQVMQSLEGHGKEDELF